MDTCIKKVFELRFSNAFEVKITHLLENQECRQTTGEHLYSGKAKKYYTMWLKDSQLS